MTPFEAYIDYLALKRHFNKPDFSYHKYHGKVNAKFSSFEKRNDRFMFYSLTKKFPDNTHEFLLANLSQKDYWIGELLEEPARKTHLDWMKRTQSLDYHFKTQIKTLPDNFNELFDMASGHPLIMRAYITGQISLETMIIIFDCSRTLTYTDRKLIDDPIWPSIRNRIIKYQPFMNYLQQPFKQAILERFSPK